MCERTIGAAKARTQTVVGKMEEEMMIRSQSIIWHFRLPHPTRRPQPATV